MKPTDKVELIGADTNYQRPATTVGGPGQSMTVKKARSEMNPYREHVDKALETSAIILDPILKESIKNLLKSNVSAWKKYNKYGTGTTIYCDGTTEGSPGKFSRSDWTRRA